MNRSERIGWAVFITGAVANVLLGMQIGYLWLLLIAPVTATILVVAWLLFFWGE